MRYRGIFIVIVSVSSFLGILLGFLTNDIIEKEPNIPSNENKNNLRRNNNDTFPNNNSNHNNESKKDDLNKKNEPENENQNITVESEKDNSSLISESEKNKTIQTSESEKDNSTTSQSQSEFKIDNFTLPSESEKNNTTLPFEYKKENNTQKSDSEKDSLIEKEKIKTNVFDEESNEKEENNNENFTKSKEVNSEGLINDEGDNQGNIENEKHEIPIGLSTDDKYSIPTLVYLTSLLENIGPNTKYHIYIMCNKLFKGNIEKINSVILKYGEEKINITYLDMGNSFKSARTNEHISTAAYYRINLPSLLPEVDKLIYTDTDVINFEDLTEMYNLEMEDNIYFRGFLDYHSHKSELHRFGVYTEIYMNSGILLMNLKALRENNVDKKIQDFINKNNYRMEHHDQTAINAVCYNNIKKLPIKYAIFTFESFEDLIAYNEDQEDKYTEEELIDAYYHPVNLHFAGYTKPWDNGNKRFKEYWWKYAQKTNYFKDIMIYYGFSSIEVASILENLDKNEITRKPKPEVLRLLFEYLDYY